MVDAACKVNIGWSVGGVRPDGYHDVAGTIQTISLLDTLRISTGCADAGHMCVEVEGAQVSLQVEPADFEALANEDNLVLRAAREVATLAAPLPTSIRLHKSIPVAAGLGGGSADAAAALVGLCVAWGVDLEPGRLESLAVGLGSDVLPILLGGLVHVSGRGERVRSIGSATDGWFVLGISRSQLSTPEVYRALDDLGPDPCHGDQPRLLHTNDLEAAALSLCPDTGDGVAAMSEAGAPVVFVSGSGPAVVGVTASEAEARQVASRASGAFSRVVVAQPVPWGVRLRLGAAPAT
ncbi:MAG TPA: 4-(cytidine 5'-diphospho)-2-C-methyl-D-erythritol kinase [Actinomycetota bacterium]|nr:4-(cytidine 5'-diphospho)-2-C-methyl-D-erythritol kinase [Actinomycetota bacterium]